MWGSPGGHPPTPFPRCQLRPAPAPARFGVGRRPVPTETHLHRPDLPEESRAGAPGVGLACGNALLEQCVVGGKWKMLFKYQEISHTASEPGSAVAVLLTCLMWAGGSRGAVCVLTALTLAGDQGPGTVSPRTGWQGLLTHWLWSEEGVGRSCKAPRAQTLQGRPSLPPHWGKHITDQPRLRPRRDTLLAMGGAAQGRAVRAGYHIDLD